MAEQASSALNKAPDHRGPDRLTAASIAAHNAQAATRSKGPTPMERWWMETEDQVVQGRKNARNDGDIVNDRCAKEIEDTLDKLRKEEKK